MYDELRQLAASYLSQERGGHTLQPTALVHEAYLRLVDARQNISWQSRAHFYGIAAQDHAAHPRPARPHARGAQSAAELEQRVSLDDNEIAVEDSAVGLVALDGALEGLAHEYPRQSEVVVLKFFGGLEAREIAGMLQVSEKTVLRDWNFARLWLYRELGAQNTPAMALDDDQPEHRTRSDRLLEIVTGALERDPAARGAFLDEACGGDAALRAEAESLLRLDEPARNFIARPAIAAHVEAFLESEAAAGRPPRSRPGRCWANSASSPCSAKAAWARSIWPRTWVWAGRWPSSSSRLAWPRTRCCDGSGRRNASSPV